MSTKKRNPMSTPKKKKLMSTPAHHEQYLPTGQREFMLKVVDGNESGVSPLIGKIS